MARGLRRLGLGVVVAGAAAACATSSERAGRSEDDHTAGEFVWRNDPQLWMTPRGLELPESNPATTRLQGWVDRFDRLVRDSLLARGVSLAAPAPKVVVLKNPDVNAYIAMMPTCITPAATGDLALLTGPTTVRTLGSGCAESSTWTLQEGRSWFNRLGGIQVLDGPVLQGTAEEVKAGRVAIYSAMSIVHVHAGAITKMSEKSIAAVLAHELGHYYRAHNTTSIADRYDFWYERTEALPERPVPATEQSEYTTLYDQLRPRRQIATTQVFHPRIVPTLIQWVARMKPPQGHACETANDELLQLSDPTLNTFYDERAPLPDAAAQRAYLALEPSMQRCFDAAKLGDHDADVSFVGDELARTWLPTHGGRDPFVTDAAGLVTARTLGELVDAMQTRALEIDDQAKAFQARLDTNHIGLYTSEQEADDLAMDLGTKLGLTPADVMEAFLELGASIEADDPERFRRQNGMSTSECRALAAAGFQVDGKDVHVALGPLADPHHALCYRVFNLHREAAAHRYVVAPASFPADRPAWATIQDTARQILDPTFVPAPAPVDAGAPARPPVTGTPSVGGPPDEARVTSGRADASGSCAASAAPRSSGGGLVVLAAVAVFLARRRARSLSTP